MVCNKRAACVLSGHDKKSYLRTQGRQPFGPARASGSSQVIRVCRSIVFRSDESTTAPCSIPSPQTSSTYSYVTCIVLVLGWLTSVSRFNSVEVLSKSAGHASLAATCRSTSQAALHVLTAVMRACFVEPPRVLKRSCENAQYYEETGRYPLRSDSLPALGGHGSSPRTSVPFYNVLFAYRHPRSTMEPWKLQTLDHGEEE
jgi:hypothetical protein